LLLPKPYPLEELLVEPLDPLDREVDDPPVVALAVELVVFVWVAASVANPMKLPSVTPSITFLSARTRSSACALGSRCTGADLAAVAGTDLSATGGRGCAGLAGRSGCQATAGRSGAAGRVIGG
jgi:hypothetical protein